MIEKSQKNSAYESHQHNILKKIFHEKCRNQLYQNRIIELVEEYFLVKSNIFDLPIDNIDIDENITKKCCPALKISAVLNKIKDYCLKCQIGISQFPQNQRRQFSNEKISFCSKCFLDIERDKSIDKSKKTSMQQIFENIIRYCKSQSNRQEDKENEQNPQPRQQCSTIDEKEFMRQYSQIQNHKNYQFDDLKKQLNNMTKSQLIEKILAMTLELSVAHKQTTKYKDQSQKNFQLRQLYKSKSEKLQRQIKILRNQSEFSFQKSNSITLINTSKNASHLESSFSKDQSKIQSEIYQINQSFPKENSDDENTLFHPQKIQQAQKIKQLQNFNYLNNSSHLQSVMEQKSEDGASMNEKPITRSQRKPISINVLNQNQHKIHMNMTTPVKGLSKKYSFKDSASMEPVNVPIMTRNVNNNQKFELF